MSFDVEQNEEQLFSDINVTPIVDVMLVLLILFIVTLPMVTHNITVNLPKANFEKSDEPKSIAISVDASGTIVVNENEITILELEAFLMSEAENETHVSIYGDGNVEYSKIIQVMATINKSGFKNIGFITTPND